MAAAASTVELYTKAGDVRYPAEVVAMLRKGMRHVQAREFTKFQSMVKVAQPGWGSSLEEFTEAPHGGHCDDDADINITSYAVPAGTDVLTVLLESFLSRFTTLGLAATDSRVFRWGGYKTAPVEEDEGWVSFSLIGA